MGGPYRMLLSQASSCHWLCARLMQIRVLRATAAEIVLYRRMPGPFIAYLLALLEYCCVAMAHPCCSVAMAHPCCSAAMAPLYQPALKGLLSP